MLDMAANTRKNGAKWAAELATKSNFAPIEKRGTPLTLIEEVFNTVAASDAESYARLCEMMVDESHVDPDYSKIDCPTLLIAGDSDVISPVSKSEDLVQLIGPDKCWLEVLECGHQPILEHPDNVATAVERLLGKIQV